VPKYRRKMLMKLTTSLQFLCCGFLRTTIKKQQNNHMLLKFYIKQFCLRCFLGIEICNKSFFTEKWTSKLLGIVVVRQQEWWTYLFWVVTRPSSWFPCDQHRSRRSRRRNRTRSSRVSTPPPGPLQRDIEDTETQNTIELQRKIIFCDKLAI